MSDDPSPVLIIGGEDSTIGKSLYDALKQEGMPVWKTSRYRRCPDEGIIYLDLSDESWNWVLPDMNFSSVVLCAGVTSIAVCEEEPERTYKINVQSTTDLARYFSNQGALVVFLSTNLVFDGEKPFARPDDPVNPQNEYGRQKAEAERLITTECGRYAVVRLGKVISSEMPLFRQWIRDLRVGKVIHPFEDMVFAPISMSFATEILCRVVLEQRTGIIHATGSKDITYAQAAYFIADMFELDAELIKPLQCRHLPGFSHVPRHAALASVGCGTCNLDDNVFEALRAFFM